METYFGILLESPVVIFDKKINKEKHKTNFNFIITDCNSLNEIIIYNTAIFNSYVDLTS